MCGRPLAPGEQKDLICIEVLVRFQEDGATKPTAVTWVDGTPPPEQVARISVFDSANARLYIDRENRIGFLPMEVALLEAHGSLRKSLDTKFKSEIARLDRGMRTPLPAGYSSGSQVSSLLPRLDSKWQGTLPTKEEVEKLSLVTAAEEQELEALNAALASDPATLAARWCSTDLLARSRSSINPSSLPERRAALRIQHLKRANKEYGYDDRSIAEFRARKIV